MAQKQSHKRTMKKGRVSHKSSFQRKLEKELMKLKVTGGTTTGDYAKAVYGDVGQQHAIPGTNVIQTRPVIGGGDEHEPKESNQTGFLSGLFGNNTTGATTVPVSGNTSASAAGGKKDAPMDKQDEVPALDKQQQNEISKQVDMMVKNLEKTQGGTALGDIAVPAVLMLANRIYGKRTSKNRHTPNKTKKSRRYRKH